MTVKKYTETTANGGYADVLEAKGLTKDFTGLSELLLGQAQPAQFQSADQTGYWWGSKVSDDGNFTALDSVANNANAEMPRAYDRGNTSLGNLFNWYAATAESGKYLMASSGTATDSICPSGWKLPTSYGENDSWANLFKNAYNLILNDGSNNSVALLTAKKFPFSLTLTGFYDIASGRGGSSYMINWTSEFANNNTLPTHRHKGYASLIMKELISDARRMTLCSIELKATDEGYSLYRSAGFTDDVSK